MYLGARLVMRVSPVAAEAMDFQSGLAEIEADTCVAAFSPPPPHRLENPPPFFCRYDEPPPKNKFEAFWGWLVGAFLPSCALPSVPLNVCFCYLRCEDGVQSSSAAHVSVATKRTDNASL